MFIILLKQKKYEKYKYNYIIIQLSCFLWILVIVYLRMGPSGLGAERSTNLYYLAIPTIYGIMIPIDTDESFCQFIHVTTVGPLPVVNMSSLCVGGEYLKMLEGSLSMFNDVDGDTLDRMVESIPLVEKKWG